MKINYISNILNFSDFVLKYNFEKHKQISKIFYLF